MTSAHTEQSQYSETDASRLPMSGIRVIDVGTFLAGPYAASVLD